MRLDKLGRYEILQELGSGTLGSVWLAHDPQRDRRAVVKILDVISKLTPEEQTSARESWSVRAPASPSMQRQSRARTLRRSWRSWTQTARPC